MENYYTILMSTFGYWHWFGLAITLILLDLIFGTHFFLVWMGGCAALVGLLVLLVPTLTWQVQLFVFALFSVASLWFWWHKVKSGHSKSDKPFLNQRASQYIGRTFTLEEPIVNGRGRISVDDSQWRVDGDDLPAGSKVVVISADGVVLKIKPKVD